jgi:hypothetical protein
MVRAGNGASRLKMVASVAKCRLRVCWNSSEMQEIKADGWFMACHSRSVHKVFKDSDLRFNNLAENAPGRNV